MMRFHKTSSAGRKPARVQSFKCSSDHCIDTQHPKIWHGYSVLVTSTYIANKNSTQIHGKERKATESKKSSIQCIL